MSLNVSHHQSTIVSIALSLSPSLSPFGLLSCSSLLFLLPPPQNIEVCHLSNSFFPPVPPPPPSPPRLPHPCFHHSSRHLKYTHHPCNASPLLYSVPPQPFYRWCPFLFFWLERPFASHTYIVKTFVMLLYFSTSTITAVGYGDIFPRGLGICTSSARARC